MPSKPLKPCRSIGCPNLTAERYCEQHKQIDIEKRKAYEMRRGSRHQRGYTSKWSRYSKAYLMMNPICVRCYNAPSQHTDHIVPVTGPNDPLFWDPANHQGLCHSCHSKKTVLEDKKGYGQGGGGGQ
jgi:5-methylcytosine-specific restriction protein A